MTNPAFTPALQYNCKTCGAMKGEPCVSRNEGHSLDIPHYQRLKVWAQHTGQEQPSGITMCRTCGLPVSGEVIGGECHRCRRVRDLWAERYAPSPRHRE